MTLPVRNFSQIVSDQTAALQVAQPLFSASPGSTIWALAEMNAGMGLFFQWLIYRTLKTTRLATSIGADADSFGADFLFARFPAAAATGQVIFSRFAKVTRLAIPLNTIVKTNDSSASFIVIPDVNNPSYSPDDKAYYMEIGASTLSVLVQAVIPGLIGNVAAKTITKIASSLAVTSVSNPAAFVNGVDLESDASYKYRFQVYINTRSAATPLAIENAIINTQPGLTYTIEENMDTAGNSLPGNIAIWVDDGTGYPPEALFNGYPGQPGLRANIEAVRPASVSFSCEPAQPVPVTIQFSTNWLPGYNPNNFKGAIAIALINYLNSLHVGEYLYLTRLYQIIYDATAGLKDAYGLLVNGLPNDLIIAKSQVARFISQIIPTPQTWNPFHDSEFLALYPDFLTATQRSVSMYAAVFGVLETTIGKFYWEIVPTVSSMANTSVGLGNRNASVTAILGSDVNSIGWNGSTGVVSCNGTTLATWAPYASASRLCFAVDFANGMIYGRVADGTWNNSTLANPATNTGGVPIPATVKAARMVPGASVYQIADTVTASFLATDWIYGPPIDFSEWVANQPPSEMVID